MATWRGMSDGEMHGVMIETKMMRSFERSHQPQKILRISMDGCCVAKTMKRSNERDRKRDKEEYAYYTLRSVVS